MNLVTRKRKPLLRAYTGHKGNSTGTRTVDQGRIYMNARYYDPYIYRMLTPDSIVPSFKNPQSLNRYSYVLNNPVKYVDFSGHYPCASDEYCPLPVRVYLNSRGYYCTRNFGCFDTAHVYGGWGDARDLLTRLRGGDTNITTAPRSYGGVFLYQHSYVVPENLTEQHYPGYTIGILMDHEEGWETLQAWSDPVFRSSYSREDLPSDYLGWYIALEMGAETREQFISAFEDVLTCELGGAHRVSSLDKTENVLWCADGMGCTLTPMTIRNYEFRPLVQNQEGQWYNVDWPDAVTMTPVRSSDSTWQKTGTRMYCWLGLCD